MTPAARSLTWLLHASSSRSMAKIVEDLTQVFDTFDWDEHERQQRALIVRDRKRSKESKRSRKQATKASSACCCIS